MRTHVRRIADRMHARLPVQVEVDDLMQEGYMGLVECLDRFDPTKQTKFETFSSQRIHGAMRDYLRKLDPVPRQVRQNERRVLSEVETFRKRHGRSPGDDELRSELDLPAPRFRKMMTSGRAHAMVHFNAQKSPGDPDFGEDSDGMRSFEDMRASDQGSPAIRAERSDLRQWITAGFPRRDKLIIILYYYEQMTMKEVGLALGISESRVSQRINSILANLRERFRLSESGHLLATGAE